MRHVAVAWLAVCAACGAGNDQRTGGRDSAPVGTASAASPSKGTASAIEVWPVNGGTQGMRSTVRWALSPDRRAIVAVEDPVSVEAEALPDGFLYASERTGTVVQLNDVWDVAPSPDWTRLAFGRAFILRGGERDTVPPEEWRRLEARLPEDVTERDAAGLRRKLEAHAFPASGMSLMLGLGLTQVMWVDSLGPGRVPAPTGPTHSMHGWRVRWSRSGDTLAAGAAPRMVQDDAAPTRWVLVRSRRWAVYADSLGSTTDSSRFARIAWTDGPTMELGTGIDLSRGREIPIENGSVNVHGDSVRVTARAATGVTSVRVIGPGVPLAATATGRFILALVPRPNAKEHEMRAQPVVYHVPPQ